MSEKSVITEALETPREFLQFAPYLSLPLRALG